MDSNWRKLSGFSRSAWWLVGKIVPSCEQMPYVSKINKLTAPVPLTLHLVGRSSAAAPPCKGVPRVIEEGGHGGTAPNRCTELTSTSPLVSMSPQPIPQSQGACE
jgi:hypothetical protein